MIITIDNAIRIKSTKHCWQVEYCRRKNGELNWEPKTYHSSLGQAVSAAVKREIRNHPASTISDALRAVDAIGQKYDQAIKSAVEQTETRIARLAAIR
jgi:hypothetical protein